MSWSETTAWHAYRLASLPSRLISCITGGSFCDHMTHRLPLRPVFCVSASLTHIRYMVNMDALVTPDAGTLPQGVSGLLGIK